MVKLSKSHSPVHLSLSLRFRFASNPLLNRSLEWEKKGLTWDLQGNYIGGRRYLELYNKNMTEKRKRIHVN